LCFSKGFAHMNDSATERSPSKRLYDVAEQQAGYFTTAQAKQAGFSYPQLTYYVRRGRFLRVKWGIYRLVLFPSSPNEDLYVAWLEAGPNAAISHASALALHDLSDVLPGEIHVTIPRSASRRHGGLTLHTNQLDPGDVTTVAGLPVTTVPRTLADVAAGGWADELVIQAIHQAIRRGLTSKVELLFYAERRGGRPRRLVAPALQELAE
jgi:predicted transcriptional regulator of viral defense system